MKVEGKDWEPFVVWLEGWMLAAGNLGMPQMIQEPSFSEIKIPYRY